MLITNSCFSLRQMENKMIVYDPRTFWCYMYLMSNEKGLKKSGLNEDSTLTPAMPVRWTNGYAIYMYMYIYM